MIHCSYSAAICQTNVWYLAIDSDGYLWQTSICVLTEAWLNNSQGSLEDGICLNRPDN